MKSIYKYILLLFIAAITGIFAGCSEDDLSNGGQPAISYIRITNPASSDSIIASAGLGQMIAIMGENLKGVREVWFNDQRAALTPTFITNTTIITTVPGKAPIELTNKLRLVFKGGTELLHDFTINLPAPAVTSLNKEYARPGELVEIRGNYFFEPITVTFTGDVTAELVSVDQTIMEIRIPEGAQPGPVTFTTNFGSAVSSFHYWDKRNILLNYDDLTAAGSWRPGPIGNEEGLEGKYLRLYGTLNANQRVEDNYQSQFWGHTRLPEGPLFQGNPEDLVLKFEARVLDWYGSVLQICWGPWNNNNNAEVWGSLNGKGIWAPWKQADASFNTGGEWITVVIPLTEMKYRQTQTAGNNVWIPDMEFDPDVAGTLSFWVIAGPEASASPVEIHIDNVRIVTR